MVFISRSLRYGRDDERDVRVNANKAGLGCVYYVVKSASGTVIRRVEKNFQKIPIFFFLPLDDSIIRDRIGEALEGSENVLSFSGRTDARKK